MSKAFLTFLVIAFPFFLGAVLGFFGARETFKTELEIARQKTKTAMAKVRSRAAGKAEFAPWPYSKTNDDRELLVPLSDINQITTDLEGDS